MQVERAARVQVRAPEEPAPAPVAERLARRVEGRAVLVPAALVRDPMPVPAGAVRIAAAKAAPRISVLAAPTIQPDGNNILIG